MDDGLWGNKGPQVKKRLYPVSILLVMDDGLWGGCYKIYGKNRDSLNPSCNG